MSASDVIQSASFCVRTVDGGERETPWAEVRASAVAMTQPWRKFRWYKGQRHYSGFYWSSTERAHVIYESRLELTRLLFADFDPTVQRIFAQPFMLKTSIGGAGRRHIPDYLLLTDLGPIVVDVKPRHRVDSPKVAFTLAWTRKVVEPCGWRFEVWSEPPEIRLTNVRFLAGYRRDWLFDQGLLEELRKADLAAATLGDAFACLPHHAAPLVRSAVLHLLWRHELIIDLDCPLSRNSVLEVKAQ
jgi:hypothetical protein